MTKNLTNSGAYLTVMVIEWARYLGINRTQVLKKTNRVMENEVKFLERTQIRVKIGRKTIFWNT